MCGDIDAGMLCALSDAEGLMSVMWAACGGLAWLACDELSPIIAASARLSSELIPVASCEKS